MEGAIEQAVGRAIVSMRENFGDQLTVDDMARAAMFSKFHFTRIFQRVTGVSPGRFLSAVRLQEAKRLLATTSLTVTEISHQVGYASVGTFSSRFRCCVGVSPTMYREVGGFPSRACVENRGRAPVRRCGTVCGRIRPPLEAKAGLVFVGLFRDRLPQGQPVRCMILQEPGPFVLEKVPPGSWYLLSHSVAADRHEVIRGPLDDDPGLFVGSRGPVTVRSDVPVRVADIWLTPARVFDPPVLLALLDLRAAAFRKRIC
ncbi:helix-turn-helix domain-containing protein [Amycolatopsis saalfeldensis]|uniref:AraC-type DNA-binding protein n=1 Tax=Amycolatopsis saalfeldensis TaxID=394193 RepID=A0A1H8YK32_9PSEU|nr:AraC family transcriptional regulator [Amycolatopsis saalfeldensis]SEP52411.1 AraC-type DNA-binding protein [Amycolatopsis saalfeldensis]